MSWKRNILAACLAISLALLIQAPSRGGGRFVTGTADLPLMPGLRELPAAALVFDKPDGRLVRAAAMGAASAAAVWKFYDETLPQLGWRRVRRGVFVRDREKLRIWVQKNDSNLTVRFAIAPGAE